MHRGPESQFPLHCILKKKIVVWFVKNSHKWTEQFWGRGRIGDRYSNYSQIFPLGDGGETKIAKGDCCQDRKFRRIPHLHTAFYNQWMAADLFLLLSHRTELSRGSWWAPLLAGQADGKKKSGLQPVIPQPAYQRAWLWSDLPNLQRNHHHLKPSWWTELLGTNRQSWLAVFALQLHASANSKYSESLFCSYFQHGWSFSPGMDLLMPAPEEQRCRHVEQQDLWNFLQM